VKSLGFTILGFALTLAVSTFFTPFGLTATLTTYGALLYLLFFGKPETSTPLLVGFTIGLELLGTRHFGIATVTSVIWYGLFLLFGERLRFTSPYARFIVALALGLVASVALLYPLNQYLHHLIATLAALIVVGIGSILLQRASEPSAYELL
jgi:hypothetical protein